MMTLLLLLLPLLPWLAVADAATTPSLLIRLLYDGAAAAIASVTTIRLIYRSNGGINHNDETNINNKDDNHGDTDEDNDDADNASDERATQQDKPLTHYYGTLVTYPIHCQ